MRLLTQGHIREQLRTGEAKTKVNIDSLFPQRDWLLRKRWLLVQPWEKAGWTHGRGNPLRATKYTENESGSGCVWATNGCKVLGGERRCVCTCLVSCSCFPHQLLGIGISSSYFIMLLFTVGLCFYLLLEGGEDWKLPRLLAAGCRETPLSPGLAAAQSIDRHCSCPVSMLHNQNKFSNVPKWLETAGSVGQAQVSCTYRGNCFQLAFSLLVSLPVFMHFQLCRNIPFSSTSLYLSRWGTVSFKLQQNCTMPWNILTQATFSLMEKHIFPC